MRKKVSLDLTEPPLAAPSATTHRAALPEEDPVAQCSQARAQRAGHHRGGAGALVDQQDRQRDHPSSGAHGHDRTGICQRGRQRWDSGAFGGHLTTVAGAPLTDTVALDGGPHD
jgi:hypothetical protein